MDNSFREYEGTEYTDTFELVNTSYLQEWSFLVSNTSFDHADFYYKIANNTEVKTGLPTGNPSNSVFVGAGNSLQFRLNPESRANDDTTTYGKTENKIYNVNIAI